MSFRPFRSYRSRGVTLVFFGLFVVQALAGCRSPKTREPGIGRVVPVSFRDAQDWSEEKARELSSFLDEAESRRQEKLAGKADRMVENRRREARERRQLNGVLIDAERKQANQALMLYRRSVRELNLEEALVHLERASQLSPNMKTVKRETRELERLKLARSHRAGGVRVSQLTHIDRSELLRGHMQLVEILLAQDRGGEAAEHLTSALEIVRRGRAERSRDRALARIRESVSKGSEALVLAVEEGEFDRASQEITDTLNKITGLTGTQTTRQRRDFGLRPEEFEEILTLIQRGEFQQAERMISVRDDGSRQIDALRQRVQSLKEALGTP